MDATGYYTSWIIGQFCISSCKKEANRVVKALHNHVFPVFGLPAIIHSDSGKEFINKLFEDVVSTWPGHVQLISDRPRHLQSQGLVEQAHYTLERMISAKVAECGDQSPPWLPHMVCKLSNVFLCCINVFMFYLSLQIQ